MSISRTTDTVGIVSFSSWAKEVCEPIRVRDRAVRDGMVSTMRTTLRCDANTNMSAGLTLAASRLEKISGGTRCIILLSDGYANAGLVGQSLVECARKISETGVRITTVTYAANDKDVDVDTLRRIAEAGNGTFNVVRDSETTSVAFHVIMCGVNSLLAQNVRLKFWIEGRKAEAVPSSMLHRCEMGHQGDVMVYLSDVMDGLKMSLPLRARCLEEGDAPLIVRAELEYWNLLDGRSETVETQIFVSRTADPNVPPVVVALELSEEAARVVSESSKISSGDDMDKLTDRLEKLSTQLATQCSTTEGDPDGVARATLLRVNGARDLVRALKQENASAQNVGADFDAAACSINGQRPCFFSSAASVRAVHVGAAATRGGGGLYGAPTRGGGSLFGAPTRGGGGGPASSGNFSLYGSSGGGGPLFGSGGGPMFGVANMAEEQSDEVQLLSAEDDRERTRGGRQAKMRRVPPNPVMAAAAQFSNQDDAFAPDALREVMGQFMRGKN